MKGLQMKGLLGMFQNGEWHLPTRNQLLILADWALLSRSWHGRSCARTMGNGTAARGDRPSPGGVRNCMEFSTLSKQ